MNMILKNMDFNVPPQPAACCCGGGLCSWEIVPFWTSSTACEYNIQINTIQINLPTVCMYFKNYNISDMQYHLALNNVTHSHWKHCFEKPSSMTKSCISMRHPLLWQFQSWLINKQGTHHIRIYPYNPSANGTAEWLHQLKTWRSNHCVLFYTDPSANFYKHLTF